MDNNWAAEHLQVIRTLMERAALYRRALAPVMLVTGLIGTLAALLGWALRIELPAAFAAYWMAVGGLALAAAFLLVRRQALRDQEPFWSPPTRRVTQALLPALTAGCVVALVAWIGARCARLEQSLTIYATHLLGFVWLPAAWIVLYGCALHAAGFFMPRGMKLFGWIFVVAGCALFWLVFDKPPTYRTGHGLMGLFFGGLHLAYGAYLWFTEKTQAP